MLKVLVVDDEKFVRKGIVMETDWASLGCVVVAEAENGLEGVEAARKYQPDLIISDIRMPKMDGLSMIRTLREENSKVKVIFLTAYGEFEYAREALHLYACDYLLKPFEDGELEASVGKACRQLLLERESSRKNREGQTLAVTSVPDKSRYLQKALEYISENYANENIGVGVIAASLGLSEGHLSHLFKKETNYTVMAYITRYRMQAAMKLLDDCTYKIYEVAEMVGYKDTNYFSSTFKKIVGVTPSEYQSYSR